MCWRSWKRNTRLFSLSAWARVVSCSSAQYSSTIWMSLFGICFPRFRFDFRCVSPTLSAFHIEVWHRDYSRACCLMFQHWQQCKSSFSVILELISYGSILILSISIISVMECMPCPLVLMAASVMDPHCIAVKSWLNNLPLLWLERLSQLFNDVSVLEGKRTHTHSYSGACTRAHTPTDGLRRTHSRTDKHGHAANETHPSSAEQLNWLHGKETPTRPLSRQPRSHATYRCIVRIDRYVDYSYREINGPAGSKDVTLWSEVVWLTIKHYFFLFPDRCLE